MPIEVMQIRDEPRMGVAWNEPIGARPFVDERSYDAGVVALEGRKDELSGAAPSAGADR
jgi:hypothetical protein